MHEEFERAYREIEKSLFLVALGYVHDTEDAKDVVQEAAISAYQAYGQLKNPAFFKTWITRIVINKSKDFLRHRRYTQELTDNLPAFCDLPTEDWELMDAICRLPPGRQLYITLRFYHDMTYDEVARLLRLPLSTVKYRTKVAMERLRECLEGDVTK